MSLSTTTVYCNPEQLILQNIITINQNALSKNFMLINKCMTNMKVFQQKFTQLEKNNKNIIEQMDRIKRRQQNDFVELKGYINQHKQQTLTLTLGNKLNSKSKLQQQKQKYNANRILQEQIRKNLRTQLQPYIKSLIQGQIAISSQKISAERQQQQKIIQTQIQKIKKQIYLIKNNKVNIQQFNSFKNYVFQNDKKKIKIQQEINKLKQINQKNNNYVDVRPEIQSIKNDIKNNVQQLNKKIKFKSDYSDTLKLQQLILGMIQHTTNLLNKKFADKVQTKKALIFLQKRINKILISLFGDQDLTDALIGTKGWKCISCTKDLKQYQGKLDKFKPWAVFPAKQITKDKYNGFGVGFQTVVQKAVQKKGIQPSYDNYGRMTTPFNLSREVNIGSNKTSNNNNNTGSTTNITNRGLSASQSNIKPKNTGQSNATNQSVYIQTNFMNNYGTTNNPIQNIKDEYKNKFSGLEQYVKFILERNKEQNK